MISGVRALVIGLVSTVLCASCKPSEEPTLADLDRRLNQLTAKLDRAESIRAVKRLQRAYGHYSEFGLWHDLADLFSDQAVGHYPAGRLVGKEKIRELFLRDVGRNVLGLEDNRLYPHIVFSPVVTLSADGNRAKGRWRILAMLGGYGGNASWAGGVYENEFAREEGVWKIVSLQFHSQYGGRYQEGLRPTPRAEPEALSAPMHYSSAAELLEITHTPAPVAESASVRDLPSLRKALLEAEWRVQRLKAQSDVANLQHAYGYYFDRKMWDDVADLFTDDGTLELGLQGVYIGKQSIRRGLEQFGSALREGEMHEHLLLQTIVTVAPDGRTAKARSGQLSMTGNYGKNAEWGQGILENEFVLENGVWKIRSVHFYPRVVTDYALGWAKSALPVPGPSKEFPPDRPPTEHYEIYPKFSIPPFHYSHPVTGRATQYPSGEVREEMSANATPPADQIEDSSVSLAQIATRLADAERLLEAVMAYDAAENVVNAYGYFMDERMWGEVAALFSRDGAHELPDVGVYVGPERVRESLQARYGASTHLPGLIAIHNTVQPVIHVAADGRSARVRTRLFEVLSLADADDAFVSGIYETELVSEGGHWRLKAVDLDYTWSAPYAAGWAKMPLPPKEPDPRALTMRSKLPPDREARGPSLPPYPQIGEIVFHYNNPVSGRRAPHRDH